MDRSEVEAKILAILRDELQLEVASPELDLIANGLIDSMALVDLVFHIERVLGVQVTLDDLDPANFARVVDITDFVLRRQAGAQ
jgi:acyl carrier protein